MTCRDWQAPEGDVPWRQAFEEAMRGADEAMAKPLRPELTDEDFALAEDFRAVRDRAFPHLKERMRRRNGHRAAVQTPPTVTITRAFDWFSPWAQDDHPEGE